MGVHKACPLPKERQPYKCKACPLAHKERYESCNFFRGQIRAGVPWKR